LVKEYGIIGSAWSNLASYIIYNTIRIVFLKRKFNLQPFSKQTVFVLAHSIICFLLIYFLFKSVGGWTGIMLRSLSFVLLFATTAIYLQLSPDLAPVTQTIKKRLRLGN
jgi:hypothetical protein